MSETGKRKQGGGDGDRPNKKKQYWVHSATVKGLPYGSRGVLVSVLFGREKKGGIEAINILSEAYEQLCPEANEASPADKGGDISTMIASEIAELKDSCKQPFRFKLIGLNSMVYIEFNYKDGPSPSDLVLHICREIKASKQNKARHCNRFYPVEYACKFNVDAVTKVAKEVAEKHFPAENSKGGTFSVELDRRCAAKEPDRMSVIKIFAGAVSQPPYKVDLNQPEKTILVSVTKDTCTVAVVEDFKGLLRYNLRALSGEDVNEGGEAGGQKAAKKKKEATEQGDE